MKTDRRFREENMEMMRFLEENGIKAHAWYIGEGSCRGQWRLYEKGAIYTNEIRNKLTSLGFSNHDGLPLEEYNGVGGAFQVFVRRGEEK